MGEREALEIARQVARGLAAAHARGIVHRDLKPENLFLTRDGHVKILDFGLAKLVSDGSGSHSKVETAYATEAGVIVGTVQYMAPEQVKGQPVDHRADLFAFGAVLYEMVSGNEPVQAAVWRRVDERGLERHASAARRRAARHLAASLSGR